jgi:hypothetical protein
MVYEEGNKEPTHVMEDSTIPPPKKYVHNYVRSSASSNLCKVHLPNMKGFNIRWWCAKN